MKLLIDAGNTRIKWACVSEDGWLRNGALPVKQADELPQEFADVFDIQQIWVSNVAGEQVAKHIRNIKVDQKVGQSGPFHFITAREAQCGVYNRYDDAAQLGSDRWAAMIAAWYLMHGRCMVVNCGTAITIDTLSERGEFLGGLVLPGVELMQRSLVGATSQLVLEHGNYAKFPLNTADAMLSGAIQACCGAIERQYLLLEDDKVPVFLSGGGAGILRESINLPFNVVDNLVLQGLSRISEEAGA